MKMWAGTVESSRLIKLVKTVEGNQYKPGVTLTLSACRSGEDEFDVLIKTHEAVTHMMLDSAPFCVELRPLVCMDTVCEAFGLREIE